MKKGMLSDYLSFSKKERVGILTVLLSILLLIFVPFLFPLFIKDKKPDPIEFKKEIAALQLKQPNDSGRNFLSKQYDDDSYAPYSQPSEKTRYKIKGELFYFDPNTISIADWKRLGVRDKTIAVIQKYTIKGGRFYKPEDLGKIWGFFPDEVERLLPYVQIQQIEEQYADKVPGETKAYDRSRYTVSPVDINSADTSAFIALPGIGVKLSQRIVAFRDKLGGFYKVEQIKETYGLPDSTFQKIRPYLSLNNNKVKQIDINSATAEELKVHPYIRWNMANAIVQYRTQHGNFASVEGIKNIMLVDEGIFAKVVPYLKVN